MKVVIEYVKMILIVVIVVVIVDGVILINAKIPSASMEKTIMTGDRIFGFRMAYGINLDAGPLQVHVKMKEPERYDIVIFHFPDNEKKLFIKRIIGLPGETLEFRDGKIYVDGFPDVGALRVNGADYTIAMRITLLSEVETGQAGETGTAPAREGEGP